MFVAIAVPFLLLAGMVPAGQSPSAQSANPVVQDKEAAPAVYKSDLGFSFAFPPDWDVLDTKPMMPAARLQEEQQATSDSEKKGAACAQIGFMIRHGSPASVILSVTLPFDCYGSRFTASDLPGLGSGVAQGMSKNFDMKDPVYGAYKSGTHNLWIERAHGSPKDHPELSFQVETVCGLLDKGMICFMGLLSDDAAMKLFEQERITLEKDAPTALVPENAFPEAGKP